ncbi:DsrE family protein [Polaribacter uvawellassae]|uniref:DsrE family protein n=1 Tax=Polaribacter uvawellassae TaxID=3133495 RepID=UPI00321AFD77
MKKYILLLAFTTLSTVVFSQNNRTEGKIIKNFGETFKVENPDIKTDTSAELKVIFDVSKTSEKKNVINKHIVTAARFLNMHADEGMKPSQLKVAMTIHADAWKDVLNDAEYKKKFGFVNPNTQLIKDLSKAGVDVIICGQTAMFRKIDRSVIIPEVKFALSAMTALLQYQNNGYKFIKF